MICSAADLRWGGLVIRQLWKGTHYGMLKQSGEAQWVAQRSSVRGNIEWRRNGVGGKLRYEWK